MARILQACREENAANVGCGRQRTLTSGGRMRKLMEILRCEKGANAIEYALVATLISIAAIGAFNNLSNKINFMYNNVSNHM
jgi:pilus assembly protein Flp/PilA